MPLPKSELAKLYTYDSIDQLEREHEKLVETDEGFHHFFPPSRLDYYAEAMNADLQAFHIGWKLKISVHPTQVKEAFDLLAAKLALNYAVLFKVVRLSNRFLASDPRLNQGGQFVVYLESLKAQTSYDASSANAQMHAMIADIVATLKDNGIHEGVIPAGEAKVGPEFLSLRNDGVAVLDRVHANQRVYLSARIAVNCWNPTMAPPPAFCMLNHPAASGFNVAAHHASFDLSSGVGAYYGLLSGLVAYLRMHTFIVCEANPEQWQQIIASYQKGLFDPRFIRPAFHNDQEVLEAIYLCIRMLHMLQSSNHFNLALHLNTATHYRRNNAFAVFLHQVRNTAIALFPGFGAKELEFEHRKLVAADLKQLLQAMVSANTTPEMPRVKAIKQAIAHYLTNANHDLKFLEETATAGNLLANVIFLDAHLAKKDHQAAEPFFYRILANVESLPDWAEASLQQYRLGVAPMQQPPIIPQYQASVSAAEDARNLVFAEVDAKLNEHGVTRHVGETVTKVAGSSGITKPRTH